MKLRASMALGAVAAFTLSLAGCPNAGSSPRDPDEFFVECGQPDAGANAAADETWVKFEEAESAGKLSVDDCNAPVLTAPVGTEPLDPDSPPLIEFNRAQPACTAALPCEQRQRFGAVLEVGIPAAEAHCTGATGENYFLELTAAGSSTVAYSALLSVTSYRPNGAAWKRALEPLRGKQVIIKIKRGVMFRGNLNDGPWVQADGFKFTVKP